MPQTWREGKKKKPTGLGGSLASDLGEGVLSQAGIEDGIGNLVTDGGGKMLELGAMGGLYHHTASSSGGKRTHAILSG